MKPAPIPPFSTDIYQHLSADQLRELLRAKDAEQQQKTAHFTTQLKQQANLIVLLEEQLRLARIQRFAAKSEKLAFQFDLFDEAELEAALSDLENQLSDDEADDDSRKRRQAKRQRHFSPELKRQRVELCLSDAEKAGASRTFFTKVKEELDYIPAQMIVLEYWQEKAVFPSVQESETERMIAASRPNPHFSPVPMIQRNSGWISSIKMRFSHCGMILLRATDFP